MGGGGLGFVMNSRRFRKLRSSVAIAAISLPAAALLMDHYLSCVDTREGAFDSRPAGAGEGSGICDKQSGTQIQSA